jgi:tetratricopeptide (TPR) repeat protein
MNETMKVQTQIRQNAEEVSSFLSNLSSWQNNIKKKDNDLIKKRSGATGGDAASAVRKGAGTVPTVSAALPPAAPAAPSNGKAATAAKHTYDVGYKKWETFDVDAAMTEDDGSGSSSSSSRGREEEQELPLPPTPSISQRENDSTALTPTSIIPPTAVNREKVTRVIPAARGVFVNADAEAAEREIGNKEFAAGNFQAAVKSYTKCLGMKGKNYVAFSNRAMAYLKLKEFHRAESDCSSALLIAPTHVKSLLRRATARNAMGKHRAALADLIKAQDEDPANKQTRAEISKTQELLLSAVTRAPLVRLLVELPEEGSSLEPTAGPDLPLVA